MGDLHINNFLLWPLRAQLITIMFICLLVSIAGYSEFIKPTTVSLKQCYRRISTGRDQLRGERHLAHRLRTKIAALAAIKLNRSTIALQLHKKITMTHVLAVFTRMQVHDHIQLVAEHPLPVKKIMGMVRQSVKLQLKGRFVDLNNFVANLVRLSWNGAVPELTLRRIAGPNHYLEMDVLFNIYTRRVT